MSKFLPRFCQNRLGKYQNIRLWMTYSRDIPVQHLLLVYIHTQWRNMLISYASYWLMGKRKVNISWAKTGSVPDENQQKNYSESK